MKDCNIIQEKSLAFAIRIVNLYKHLVNDKFEYVMSKQLLRSGTSIGANASESISAESRADFIHKLSIAQKETDETIYWLTLLWRTDYLSLAEYQSVISDCKELKKILVSIILSVKQKRDNS